MRQYQKHPPKASHLQPRSVAASLPFPAARGPKAVRLPATPLQPVVAVSPMYELRSFFFLPLSEDYIYCTRCRAFRYLVNSRKGSLSPCVAGTTTVCGGYTQQQYNSKNSNISHCTYQHFRTSRSTSNRRQYRTCCRQVAIILSTSA